MQARPTPRKIAVMNKQARPGRSSRTLLAGHTPVVIRVSTGQFQRQAKMIKNSNVSDNHANFAGEMCH